MPRKPRIPKPWQRKDRNNDWYVTIHQKQYFLGPADASSEEVRRALAALLLQANVEVNREDGPVAPILERYLDHVEKHHSAETYRMRKKDLQSFIDYLEATRQDDIVVKDLKPYHVTQWLD